MVGNVGLIVGLEWMNNGVLLQMSFYIGHNVLLEYSALSSSWSFYFSFVERCGIFLESLNFSYFNGFMIYVL